MAGEGLGPHNHDLGLTLEQIAAGTPVPEYPLPPELLRTLYADLRSARARQADVERHGGTSGSFGNQPPAADV